MRLIVVAATTFVLALTFAVSGNSGEARNDRSQGNRHDGQAIFRFDTFGDEQLWSDVLRMHEVISTVSPATALSVGLKVDVDALPQNIIDALAAGQVDLNNPAVTMALLRLNSVVGVGGRVSDDGRL